jgi:nicotinamidase-related amidase
MAVTTLDPEAALIIVDLQNGIVAYPTVHPTADVVARSRALADAFRARGLPVALVNVAGGAPGRTEQPRNAGPFPGGWTDFVPELGRQPTDIVVTKRTWGAFASTDLEHRLKARGVTQAYEAGFNVTLAIDAMTDMRADAHDYSIAKVFPRLGETGTTQQIIDLLNKRST